MSQKSAPADMDHPSGGHVMLNVTDLKWMDAPPGLPKGAKIAVLSGDPSWPGPFTMKTNAFIKVNGEGPFAITYINQADDRRSTK